MQIWLGVENFAKIESAKINISSYTLLVGPNNSGKTFLMQLVQGINEKFVNLLDEDVMDVLRSTESAEMQKFELSSDNISQFTEYMNKKLEAEKEHIVKEIFGRDIPIERLYVDIFMEEDTVYEILVPGNDADAREKMIEFLKGMTKSVPEFLEKLPERAEMSILIKRVLMNKRSEMLSLTVSFSESKGELVKQTLSRIIDIYSLFLPASRAGLMLLYREYFANKADSAVSYRIEDSKVMENKPDYRGLTQPMYKFLRFLQTYREDSRRIEKYHTELSFFEEKLIEGKIQVNQNGLLSYSSGKDTEDIPMYLASSMINEIAPLELVLTGSEEYECLIIDEVEASLHPEKQMELARFLNRLSNKGMKLILSTHSDTFVSKVNNLYILSRMVKDNGRTNSIRKLRLEQEELIDPEKLHVYEFVSQSNGKSVVKEIIGDSQTGFQFDLFTESAMQLYEEALKLGEVQKDDKT